MPSLSFVLFSSLALLLLLKAPIAVSLGLSAGLTLAYSNLFLGTAIPLILVPQKMLTSVDSFPLMAIPFFMIAGKIMEYGGISRRLIDVAQAAVGSSRGGLALVTVTASMFFAAISGSSPATVAAIGAIMIPAMVDKGYPLPLAAATQASAGYIGVIIPPSIPMITYGVVTGTSIGGLFLAGLLPGLLAGLSLMAVAFLLSAKPKEAGLEPARPRMLAKALGRGFWAILMPVIILGGIYSGLFTPTEAAAVAVAYGAAVSFLYKELRPRHIPLILKQAAISSAMVMLIVATATAFGVILTRERIPMAMASYFIQLTDSPFLFLTLVNVLLLILGTFMETNAGIILVAPILFPVASSLGVDPMHFGIVIVVNLAVGMITPPLGVNLFVACGLTKLKVERIVRANWPYLLASLLLLFVLTYFPAVSLALPRLFR
jgi:C4-dicarboxylate transporter DctM subunit